jgi:mannose-6-phosphate isomerase-like protein (cupin superfamily)
MKHKYVINCYDPNDWLFQLDDGVEDSRHFTLPIGEFEKNETSDTLYHEGAIVPYHQHSKGYETFYIPKGSVEAIIRGKRCLLGVGDMLHLAPATPHSFKFLEEGTVWRELFQEIHMVYKSKNKVWIQENYDGLYFDPVFRAKYMKKELLREEPVSVQDVHKTELHEVRPHDFAFSVFSFDGMELRQKVGRWECNNLKEIWQAIMQKGAKVSWSMLHSEPALFLVEKGTVKITTIDGEYTAYADNIIDIPPYMPFSIEALENDTIIYDYDCNAHLLSMLEDMASVRKNDHTRIDTPEKLQAFMEKYECYVTEYSYK